MHTNFADRLWNFKSVSQTAAKLSAMGVIDRNKINSETLKQNMETKLKKV